MVGEEPATLGPPAPEDPYQGIDLTGARTLKEKVIRIGQHLALTGTALNLTKATRVLFAWGDTVQSVDGLRNKVSSTLAGLPDFRRVGVGYYEYLPDEEIARPSPKAVAESILSGAYRSSGDSNYSGGDGPSSPICTSGTTGGVPPGGAGGQPTRGRTYTGRRSPGTRRAGPRRCCSLHFIPSRSTGNYDT